MANLPFSVHRLAEVRREAPARRAGFSADFESGATGRSAIVLSILLHGALVLGGISVVNALPAKQSESEVLVFVEPLEMSQPSSQRVPEVPAQVANVQRERVVMPAAAPNKLLVAEDEVEPGDDAVVNGETAHEELSHGVIGLAATSETNGQGVGDAPVQRVVPTISKPKTIVDLKPIRNRWLASVSRTVLRRAARNYSQRSRRRHEEGTVRVSLTVDGSGRITSARVASSSGYAGLDQSAIHAVQSIGNVPPPPPELAWGERPIIVPVEYRLR